jgi:hypothetical protein
VASVCRAKGQLGVKAVPDRRPTLARAPQPLAQPKQGIVRGPLKSTSSDEPCFRTFAGNTGNTKPAIRTPILASTAVRCEAVMINPEFRYTPEPACCPFRIIAAVAIQGPPLSFRSAPLDMIGTKSAAAKQRANAKRTLSSPCRKRDQWAQGNAEVWRGISVTFFFQRAS